MKNILEFNNFKQYKSTDLITEAAGTDDKYFENVKGNLAGAENTLIGSAVLKLFGFIKRKGMEAYLSGVLKQKLGRQYFNNILRFVVRTPGIVRPKEKEAFEVKSISENNEASGNIERIKLTKDENNGLYAFDVGATVTKESDGSVLEDGKYSFLYYVGSTFTVAGGVISDLDTGLSTPQPEFDEIKEIQTEVEEEEDDDEIVDNEKDEFKEEQEKIAEETSAEKDVIDDCNKIKELIKSEVDNGTFTVKKKKGYIHKIQSQLDDLKRLGISEIDKLLKSDDISAHERTEIENDRKIYSANILELYKLLSHISNIEVKAQAQAQVQKKPQAQVIPEGSVSLLSYANMIFEKEKGFKAKVGVGGNEGGLGKKTKKKINTNKVSDELQELNGKTIDLNDKEFYMQFEKEGNKEKVTNIILENKADIAKIQLQAERIIGNSAKMKNSWERMVQDVLGKYSKFMIVDKVNPVQLKGTTSSIDNKEKKEDDKDNIKGRDDGDKVVMSNALEKIKPFNNIASRVTNGKMKELNNKDIGLLYATINGKNALWVLQYNELNIGDKLKRVAYRVLGYISTENQKKLQSNPEAISSIKEYITTQFYGLFTNDIEGIKINNNTDKFSLKGMYIFGKSSKFSFDTNNSATIGLLYYNDNFDVDNLNTYSFKLLSRDKKGDAFEITKKRQLTADLGRRYEIKVNIDNAACAWRIESSKSSQLLDFIKHDMNSINDTINQSLNSVVKIKSNKK